MTKQELKDLIALYSHRDDLDVGALMDSFIELAASRIGRDSRLTELERRASQDVSEFIGLPFDYARMRNVTRAYNGHQVTMRAVTPAQFDDPVNSSGQARDMYCIKNGQIHIKGSGRLTLDYWVRPATLETNGSTNFVLDSYPQLYLYGALVEVYFYTQDGEARDAALVQFTSELELCNTNADRQRYNNGAIKRVD